MLGIRGQHNETLFGVQHQLDAESHKNNVHALQKYTQFQFFNLTSLRFSLYVEYFYDPCCLTLVPLLKVGLRNGANERKNQTQLFEVLDYRLGVPVCLSCLATLLLWGSSQLIKTVFIGLPRVHLWVTQAMTATSMYSQAQGSPLNNSTSYDRAKSKIKIAWRQPHMYHVCICVALVKCIASKHCDVNVTFAAFVVVLFHLWTDTSDIHWPQWCCRSNLMPCKREKVLWKWGAVMDIRF